MTACTTIKYVHKDHLLLNKGDNIEDVKISTGLSDLREIPKEYMQSESKFQYLLTRKLKGPIQLTYIYAFKDKRLLYWGHVHEFKREDNLEIRTIGQYFVDNDSLEIEMHYDTDESEEDEI